MLQANKEEVEKMLHDFFGLKRWENVIDQAFLSDKIPRDVLCNNKVMISPIRLENLKKMETIQL